MGRSWWSSILTARGRLPVLTGYCSINPGGRGAGARDDACHHLAENLYDADYVSKYTLGLRTTAGESEEDRWSEWRSGRGISAADIRRLANETATTRPAVIRLNYGVQRSERGDGYAHRGHAALHHRIMEEWAAGCRCR